MRFDEFVPVNHKNLVSVVTCFLNGAPWLAEAIESVLQQNYSHWELILIDDGSTDGATDIAKSYASRYPERVRYFDHDQHRNLGLTISRNRGIAESKGEWVALLDADDCWFPGKLAGDLRMFELNPTAAMVCQASQFWYSWADPDKRDVYTPVGAEGDRLYPPFSLTEKLYPLGAGAPPCPSGITLRKKTITELGGFEESFTGIYGLYEDQAFLAKVYLHEFVFVCSRANNLYRKRPGSMTDTLEDPSLYRTVRGYFLKWFSDYLEEHPAIPDRIKSKVADSLALLTNQEGNRLIPE